MTSYPFDRVWHNGRGIVFAKSQQEGLDQQTWVGTPRSMHTTVIDEDKTDEDTYRVIENDSDGDNESFTTAPEQYDHTSPESDRLVESTAEDVETTEAAVEETPIPVLSVPTPPLTALEYNVCRDAFFAAQVAPEDSEESFWSYKLYRGPPGEDGEPRKVTVHYCTSKTTMERVSKHFVDEEVLGFDMEWRPNATKASGARDNCSLIQIASPSRIGLFHIAVFPTKDEELVAPTFKKIMEDPNVTKVGVNIRGDCTRLRSSLGVDSRGAFELSHLYKLVRYSATRADLVNKRVVAMATQVKECLGLPLFKGLDVRASDWAKRLNMEQVYYSASDAYAGLQLYHVLDELRLAMEPTPPRPYHVELNMPIRLATPIAPAEDKNVGTGDEAADSEAETTATEALPGYPVLNMAMNVTAGLETKARGSCQDLSNR